MNEDRFADLLDGMVSGAPVPDSDPLVRFARKLHEQETSPLDDNHRTAIWRNLMATHAHNTPTSGGAGPLSQPTLTDATAFNPWAVRRTLPASKRTRMGIVNDGIQMSVTALAIVAVVIAAFTAFPVLRGDRMPEVTPTAFAAAPTVESGGDNQNAMAPISATPADEDTSWLAYIQPEECSAEPLDDDAVATIVASPDARKTREYLPLTTPAPEDAEAAARTARAADACVLGTDGNPPMISALMTDRYIAEQHAADAPGGLNEALEQGIEIGKQISAAYPDSVPTDLMRLSNEVPDSQNEMASEGDIASFAYPPSMAVQFPDGRIGVPAVIMFWEDASDAPTQEEIDNQPWVLTGMIVLADESGTWQVDELLPFCLGDCEEGWAMRTGDTTPEATPKAPGQDLLPLPGTPVASQAPEPTASLPSGDIPQPTQHPVEPLPPTTPAVLYRHPRSADCTVEPLTVDEIIAILEGKSSGRGATDSQSQNREPMDEETYDALADTQRAWLACRVYGSPFQMWALESDELIRTEFRQAYFPHYNLELIREELVRMQAETPDLNASAGITWKPPSDTYIPMVPEYDASTLPMSGHATLPIVWMNSNGDVIPMPGSDGAVANSLESRLPNAWSFVQDEASGRWLLDGYGVQWGVTSTTMQAGSDEDPSPSTMQPVQPLPAEVHAAPTETTSGGDVQGSSQTTVHPIEPLPPTEASKPTPGG